MMMNHPSLKMMTGLITLGASKIKIFFLLDVYLIIHLI